MKTLFFKQVDAISTAVFRIGFGAILLFECVNYGVFLCPECLYWNSGRIDPAEHLTFNQHRKMTCIPDMLWQFAQFVHQDLSDQGIDVVSVKADVMCSLNGREPARLVNKNINPIAINRSEPTENWLLPLRVPLR